MIATGLVITAVMLLADGNPFAAVVALGLALWAVHSKLTRPGRPWYRGG